MTVKIAVCHDNKYNARRKYFPSIIKDRAASIAADGQKVAAAACAHPDRPGEYILIDGGCLRLQWHALPPRVIALLRLPRLAVAFTFDGVDEAVRQRFMKRFDLTMQRGGG